MDDNARRMPNIMVTGTRGTGKSTTCSLLSDATLLEHINIADFIDCFDLHHGWDDQLDCHIINEDQVCGALECIMKEGGIILDYHGCGFFPRDWFDCVVVLRTDESILRDRLSSRGYAGEKLINNIEGEFADVVLEEAKASHGEDNVVELQSNTVEDIDRNVAMVIEWMNNYWRPKGST